MLLDHADSLKEQHLRRLIREYVGYYQADRTHHGLGKGTPDHRLPEPKPSSERGGGSLARGGVDCIIATTGGRLMPECVRRRWLCANPT